MSRLGCPCGHTIRDNTDGLPYKASFIKNSFCESFSDWLVQEIQSYVLAAERGSISEWLRSRSYDESYVSLKLDHGNTLYDHIHSKYLALKRDVYECPACGRLHIETSKDNMFLAYSPESEKNNGALSE